MRRILMVLAFAAASFSFAGTAQAFDDPKALLQALYAPYLEGDGFDWSNWDETKFRSKALNALFARDAEEANGEVGRLDFDPYIDGQDYQLGTLDIGEPVINDDRATVEVSFTNFDTPEHMTFTLIRESDGWKIDDVASTATDFKYSLHDIMAAPR